MIYIGDDIYNKGSGGGGGGGLPEGYEVIGNRVYRSVTIGSQVWLGEDLDLTWDGLVMDTPSSSNDQMIARPPYNKQYQGGQGLYYNWRAAKYLDDHRDTLCPGWRVPSRSDLSTLKSYINNDGKKLMYFPGNWYNPTPTNDSNITLMGIEASGYYSDYMSDIQNYFYLWTREQHTETNRAYGFQMDVAGSISESYYWYKWEFKLRLIKET